MTDVPYGERIVTSLIPVPQFSSRTDPWKTTLASSKKALGRAQQAPNIRHSISSDAYQNRFICLIARAQATGVDVSLNAAAEGEHGAF